MAPQICHLHLLGAGTVCKSPEALLLAFGCCFLKSLKWPFWAALCGEFLQVFSAVAQLSLASEITDGGPTADCPGVLSLVRDVVRRAACFGNTPSVQAENDGSPVSLCLARPLSTSNPFLCLFY